MNQGKPFGILYVEDESMSLKYFRETFQDIAPIYTAENPVEGFEVFLENENKIGLIVSDQKMPLGTGIEFLSKVKEHNPRPLRILVTAYTDFDAAVKAFNDGLLYSYFSKPWDPEELEGRIVNALDFFAVSHHRDILLREKSLAFQQLTMADKASSMNILSGGLNHHMRNALTAVHTFLELTPLKLEEELGGPPADDSFWCEYLDQVRSEIGRMTHVLSHLSEASLSGNLKITPQIDLVELFNNAKILVIGETEEIKVSVRSLENEVFVSGDAAKLNQLARLLFKEAKTNLAGAGNIEIIIEEMSDGGAYSLSFIDDGPEIEEDDLNRWFDPFFVRANQPEEFGINMIACYLIVYHHGGSMAAEHLPDGRNAIHFTLPQTPTPPEENIRISREVLRGPSTASDCEVFLPS